MNDFLTIFNKAIELSGRGGPEVYNECLNNINKEIEAPSRGDPEVRGYKWNAFSPELATNSHLGRAAPSTQVNPREHTANRTISQRTRSCVFSTRAVVKCKPMHFDHTIYDDAMKILTFLQRQSKCHKTRAA